MIKLNVGGTIFITSPETISSEHSMLAAMIQHENPAKMIDGAYFIDRDPEVFRWILNFFEYDRFWKMSHMSNLLNLILH